MQESLMYLEYLDKLNKRDNLNIFDNNNKNINLKKDMEEEED